MNAQKSVDGILALSSGNLEERIAFWIIALTQSSGSDIKISCRQRDLYSLFGVQRTSFFATLFPCSSIGTADTAFIFDIFIYTTKIHIHKTLHIIPRIFYLYYTYISIYHATKCNKFAM